MKIFYRLSDGSYPKVRFDNATKKNCLHNFIENFMIGSGDNLTVIADNVRDDTLTWLQDYLRNCGLPHERYSSDRSNAGSSAAAFRLVMEDALKLDDNELVYFMEDDYWHLSNSRKILLEGLDRADYCSLYLHGDRFIPSSQGGNKFVDDSGSFVTRIFRTNSSFWCQVESTTMTFATRISTLREDKNIWDKHIQETYPQDFNAWLELAGKGRTLITPIPGMSTHCEPKWASPGIDWENELGK